MAYDFWNDFVNHKEKNNSTPLMYDINNWKHYVFLQRIKWSTVKKSNL